MVLKEVDFWSLFPMVLKEVSFWYPSSMVLKKLAFYMFLDSLVLKEVDFGSFLPLLMDGPERTLLPVSWSLVLKEAAPLTFFLHGG